jgi:dephospho-CoA kinase
MPLESLLFALPAQLAPTLVAALLGLLVGSFLNVVIYRIPKMMQRESDNYVAQENGQPPPHTDRFNLTVPRSACPCCGHQITAMENIPVISYLVLGGKCRKCKTPISPRYPAVELFTAIVSGLLVWTFGSGAMGMASLVFAWLLIAMTFIDYDTQLLPDDLTYPLLWAGLLINLNGTFVPLQDAVIGAAARRPGRVAGLDRAADHHPAVVGRRRHRRHQPDRVRQARARQGDSVRPLPGGGGPADDAVRRAAGRLHGGSVRMTPAFSVGLTGGIGCGKSTVADLFAALGATIVDTDVIAHALTAPQGAAMPAIVAEFGPDFAQPDGALDRARMRTLVFSDATARARLEAILHPRIRAATEAAGQAATGAYVIYVVPLLIESGSWRERVTRVLAIDCSEDTQVARVMQRSHLSADEVRAIMATQVTRARRLAEADDVVDNDAGLEALRAQVQALHERYLALSL